MGTISPISRPRRANNRLPSMALQHSGSRGFTQGFTFVELIFVVALVTIAAAVAIPQFKRSFDSLVLQNFISDFTAFTGYAQAKAVSGGSEIRVEIDLPQKRLTAAEKERRIPDSVSVDLKGGTGKITFYPDGSSDKEEFEISGRYGKKYSVSVEPGTGYVNVKETQ